MIYNFFTDEKETRQERLSSMLRIPWIEPVSNGGILRKMGKKWSLGLRIIKKQLRFWGGHNEKRVIIECKRSRVKQRVT